MGDMLKALLDMEARLKPKNALVNIDDLLVILRGLRKLGYIVRRVPHRAMWEVRQGDYMTELYVDTTRRWVVRGTVLLIDKPKWEIAPRIELELPRMFTDDSGWKYRYPPLPKYGAVIREDDDAPQAKGS